jgi:hypothetical protein
MDNYSTLSKVTNHFHIKDKLKTLEVRFEISRREQRELNLSYA